MRSFRLFDQDWLDRTDESVIDPGQPILDAHHHILPSFDPPYGLTEFEADLGSGHRIVATVYMEALTGWDRDVPRHLRPVGETRWAAALGSAADGSGPPRIAAGIVGHAQFEVGGALTQEALEAHVEAGRGRFKGLRANLFSADDIDLGFPQPPPDLSARPVYREGFACLAPMGLVCDVFAFADNLPAVVDLATAFPDTLIVIDHCGVPIKALSDSADCRARYSRWQTNIRALAACDNVWMKVGGAGGGAYSPLSPLDLHHREQPIGSEELAATLQALFDDCLEAFGPTRIMLESNFPIDRRDYGYGVLWNAFKRLAANLSSSERDDLFWRTASIFYSIGVTATATKS